MKKREYQDLLECIVNSTEKQAGDFQKTAELATELLCQQLAVTYVGVCMLSCKDNQISSTATYGPLLPAVYLRPAPSDCPDYIAELRNKCLLDISDVDQDLRVKEIADVYFKPKGILSSLDVAIRINGHLEGVLYLERTFVASWTDSEIHIATHVADQLALTLATRNAFENDERLTLLLSADEESEQMSMLINLKIDLVEYVNQAHEFV